MSYFSAFKKPPAWANNTLLRRHSALLGGTANAGDCLVALRYLLAPLNLVSGNSISEYERAFAHQIGVRYAYSFSSGRVCLYALLKAMGIGAGDEVLLQVPTHIVVANAIRYSGAQPVYVDCSLDNFNIDLDDARRKITPRTKALILQHTFGIPVNMEDALGFGNEYGVPIIEDCVHSLGARYDGKPVGSFGKAAFFSTEETKIISTTMGGMAVTDDPEIARKLSDFRENCPLPSAWLVSQYLLKLVVYHLLMQPHFHRYARRIYQLLGNWHPLPRPTSSAELLGQRPENYEQLFSNAQAAIGLRQLNRLNSNLDHRMKIANLYRERLSEIGFKLPRVPAKAQAAFVRFPFLIEDRNTALKITAPYLVAGTWFTSVLEEALSPIYGGYQMGSCPKAEIAAKHIINLPTHPRITVGDAEKFIEILTKLKNDSPGNFQPQTNGLYYEEMQC